MDKIKEKLDYLYEMLEKYDRLNQKTNYNYNWRSRGINERIIVLEDILEGVTNEFDECYAEDVEEAKREFKGITFDE